MTGSRRNNKYYYIIHSFIRLFVMPKQHIKYIKHTKIQPVNLKIKLESYITDKTAACFLFISCR